MRDALKHAGAVRGAPEGRLGAGTGDQAAHLDALKHALPLVLIASTLTLLYTLLTHYLEQRLLEDEGSGSGA